MVNNSKIWKSIIIIKPSDTSMNKHPEHWIFTFEVFSF